MPGGRPKKVRTGPKKPLSAYTLFVMEVRNLVSKENPTMPFQEVAATVGRMWRELDQSYREKYQQLAEEDRVRYDKEKEEWRLRALQEPALPEKPKRRKRKGAPKNPLSAYTYYIMDVRRKVAMKHPHLSFKEVAVRVGQMWRELGESERQKYMQKAEQDKTRYENEMIEWNARLQVEASEAIMEEKKKKHKKNRPKNPLSAYTYFVMERRPQVSVENPTLSFGEIATKVGNMWRDLSPEERAKYEQMALDDKDRFDREKQTIQDAYASIDRDAMLGYHYQQMQNLDTQAQQYVQYHQMRHHQMPPYGM